MDVTKDNFSELCGPIISSVKKSSFISFDCEFNGIPSTACLQNSLFDTPSERYQKIKTASKQTIITQFGISIYTYNRNKNEYSADTYTFHLCPQWLADIDQAFLIQASSLHFLRCHSFDFNKFIYKGISYLSLKDAQHIRDLIKNNTLYSSLMTNLSIEEHTLLKEIQEEVTLWKQSLVKMEKVLQLDSPIMRFIIKKELQSDRIKVSYKSDKVIVQYVPANGECELFTVENNDKIFCDFLNEMYGFTYIFEAVRISGKPIIGHNLLYDLMLTFNQFVAPLPSAYETFKIEINKIFPVVYDTKHITSQLQKYIRFDLKNTWENNSLPKVYYFFKHERGQHLTIYSPNINANVDNGQFHNAGWDSYCTGYIFVKLAHFYACRLRGTDQLLGVKDHLTAMKPFCNGLNLLRASRAFIILDKPDPPIHRPTLLYLQTKSGNPIDISQVSRDLNIFGSMDIKKINSTTLLIAFASHDSAKGMVSFYANDDRYNVRRYREIGFLNWSKATLWSCSIAAGGALLIFLWTSRK